MVRIEYIETINIQQAVLEKMSPVLFRRNGPTKICDNKFLILCCCVVIIIWERVLRLTIIQ